MYTTCTTASAEEECTQGRVFTDLALTELQAEERRATYVGLARTLAALHSVDPRQAGLGDYGRLTGYCARQVSFLQSTVLHTLIVCSAHPSRLAHVN